MPRKPILGKPAGRIKKPKKPSPVVEAPKWDAFTPGYWEGRATKAAPAATDKAARQGSSGED